MKKILILSLLVFVSFTSSVAIAAGYRCSLNSIDYSTKDACEAACKTKQNCVLPTLTLSGNTIEQYLVGVETTNTELKIIGPDSTVNGVINFTGFSISGNSVISSYVNKIELSGQKIILKKNLTTSETVVAELTVTGASMQITTNVTNWINRVYANNNTLSFYSGTSLVATISFTPTKYVCPGSVDSVCTGTPSQCDAFAPCFRNDFLCAKDINNDSYISDTEMQSCLSTENNYLCPIDKVKCNATTKPASCPSGTVLNTSTDKCEANPLQITCDSAFTYDSALDTCTSNATCSGGGSLNTNTDKCEILVSSACPSGYSFNSALDICTKSPDCSNGSYNPLTDRCEIAGVIQCPTGTTHNSSTGKCEATPACASGFTYNTTANLCVASAIPTCPSGTTYNASTGKCESTPACSTGSYNPTTNRCETAANISCPTGYTYNGSYCVADPTCPSPGSFVSARDRCEASASGNWSCSVSFTLQPPIRIDFWSFPGAQLRCSSGLTPHTVFGYIFEGSPVVDYCVTFDSGCVITIWRCSVIATEGGCSEIYYNDIWATVFPGYAANVYFTLSGWVTAQVVTVTNTSTYAYQCPSGYTYTDGSCISSPRCPAGSTYNNVLKKCVISPNYSCPSGWTLSGSVCYASSVCPAGSFLNTTTDKCEASPSQACSSGTYNPTLGLCTLSASCPASTVLNSTTDKCEATITYSCPAGTTENGGICISNPVCNVGVFDAALDLCKIAVSSFCVSPYTYNPSTDKCEYSPPTCNAGGTYSDLINKCTKEPSYLCPSGSVYYKPNRKCEASPICSAGVYDPQINLCFEGYNTCPYPTGSACLTDSDGQKKCSPFTCVNPALSSTTNDSANLTSLQADGTVDEQGNCSGKILIFNGSPGECRPAGLKTNYKSCCDPDLSQSNLLNSCSQNERMTAVRDRDGLCHYVGEYCKNKITGVGCVQKARVYCCFNSKLARIIQEQGRIQLGIGWGDAKSPDCRGFGPDEFSMLDLSKMDLSEFLNSIQAETYTTIIQQQNELLNDKVKTYAPK